MNWALFEVRQIRLFGFTLARWTVFAGWFNHYDDACGYAFNILGHDTSATFSVVKWTPEMSHDLVRSTTLK